MRRWRSVARTGAVFAKGIAHVPASRAGEWQGRRTADLPPRPPREVVHRDDLVLLADR